jgi:hypothetical protein
MRYVRWIFLVVTIAAVWACTPFVGRQAPDGGVAGSGGVAGATSGDSGTGRPALSMTPGIAGSSIVPGSTSDGGLDTVEDVPVSQTGSLNGAPCRFDTDCHFGHCVEGVCCESVCAAQCMSCLAANTSQADGKCALVRTGLPHASDCLASDPSTCGLDGKCDGAGACRRFAAGTSCSPETCSDSGTISNYTPTRMCDGAGTCISAPANTCGGTYRCNGTKCKTTCAGPADCTAGAYCSGTSCMTKKAEGAVCSAAVECSSGVCGGRCCASGCSCPQPSGANVLGNPGIDSGTTAWMISGGTLSRSVYDANKCPYSGSLSTTLASGSSAFIQQCVPNVPLLGNFNFGADIRMTSVTGLEAAAGVLCLVRFYTGLNCDADEVADNESLGLSGVGNVDWQPTVPESPGPLSIEGANSVLFYCQLSADPNAATTFEFDRFYVSKEPATF